MRRTALALAAALASLAPHPGDRARAQPQAPGPTLSAVRQRDALVCGAHPGAPGFGLMDSQGVYRGLDADTCRAVAAAVLGDANKVRWVVLSSQARLPALQSGQVDLLARTTTWTQTRDTANGLNFAATNFYDGQGFLVRRALNVRRAGAGRRHRVRHLRHHQRTEPGGLGPRPGGPRPAPRLRPE